MKSLLAACLLLSCAASTHAIASERETVYWYVPDFPPVTIRTGQFQNQGWGDRRVEILRQRLDAFDHGKIQSGGDRFINDVKAKPNVCMANLLKTPEREQYMEFSKPLSWILPNGVITTRLRLANFREYMNEHGELRLGDMLNGGKQRLAILSMRSFGPGIDPILRKHTGHPRLIVVPSANHSSSRLLKLATQDEYDAMIGYAVELKYLTRELELNAGDFVFLPVVEELTLIPTYVGCSKSDLGKRVIAAVNQAFTDARVLKEDLAAYKFWLDDQAAAHFDRLRVRVVE